MSTIKKEKEKSNYYKYFYEVEDNTKECGWRWEQCDYSTYKEKRKQNKYQVCKSRN